MFRRYSTTVSQLEKDDFKVTSTTTIEEIIRGVRQAVDSSEMRELNTFPLRKEDKRNFVISQIKKCPPFPRALTVFGNTEPLSRQKTLQRQVLKAIKHL